jgi:hypothetical protein
MQTAMAGSQARMQALLPRVRAMAARLRISRLRDSDAATGCIHTLQADDLARTIKRVVEIAPVHVVRAFAGVSMRINIFSVIGAVALAVTGGSSQAATSSASLQDISVTYTDLDPGDGFAPSQIPGPASSGYAADLDGQAVPGSWDVTDGFLTAGSILFPYGQYPYAGVSGSMSTAGNIVVEADATMPGGAAILGFASAHWMVAPYTSVTLSANIVLQSFGDAGPLEIVDVCILPYDCAPFQTSSVGTFTHFSTVTVPNYSSQFLDVEISLSALAEVPGVPEPPPSAFLLAASALLVCRHRHVLVASARRAAAPGRGC